MPSPAVVVGDARWEEVTLSPASDYLVEGQNVIAIHALNAGLSSSDLSIDVALTSESTVAPPATGDGDSPAVLPAWPARRGLSELDAVWDSEEITAFSSTVTIPASGCSLALPIASLQDEGQSRRRATGRPRQFTAG
jgi:hypothetical protein